MPRELGNFHSRLHALNRPVNLVEIIEKPSATKIIQLVTGSEYKTVRL
jgi:hypothetical protein